MAEKLYDKNIRAYATLVTPLELKTNYPLTKEAETSVRESRKNIENILDKTSLKKIIIVGPCSIHDSESAIEYSLKLKTLSEKVKDEFLLVMRTYFEKPRTIDGWKGLIYDPDLDNSTKIEKGLEIARKLLIDISEIGLPTATEFLNTLTPQYIDDLISFATIGARTSESQPHRQMASGLSMPVGFKNATSGDIDAAINAIKASSSSQSFLGIDHIGRFSLVTTKGNPYTFTILRGGNGKPNYNSELVNETQKKLRNRCLNDSIIIDCSHDNVLETNSSTPKKNYKLQPQVFQEVIDQIIAGNESIVGAMLESNLEEGNQKLVNPKELKPGISITDACISFKTTEQTILENYERLKNSRTR